LLSVRAGKVVNAEVKLGGLKGNGPLKRDRRLVHGGEHAEKQRSFNAVVIRERDESVHPELLLDLILLDFVSGAWTEGRSPIAVGEI
jgi:hypothetical protein